MGKEWGISYFIFLLFFYSFFPYFFICLLFIDFFSLQEMTPWQSSSTDAKALLTLNLKAESTRGPLSLWDTRDTLEKSMSEWNTQIT